MIRRQVLIDLAQKNELINGASFYGYSEFTELPSELPLPNYSYTVNGEKFDRVNLYTLSSTPYTIGKKKVYLVALTVKSCSNNTDIMAALNLADLIFIEIEQYIQAHLAKSTLKRIAGCDPKPYTLATLANIIEGTQTYLATQLGISQRQISGIRRGADVRLKTLSNFKKAYPLLAYDRLEA